MQACATVYGDAISSGIVGYQQITVPNGYSLFTVTFKNVGGGDYDAQDIKPDTDTNGKIYIQKLEASGEYANNTYNWRANKSGWCKSLALQDRGVITFTDGEGMVVNNTTGSEVVFQVSGEVVLQPWTGLCPVGYTLIGNMTPVEIDAQDIIPYLADASGVSETNGKIYIQKLETSGEYADNTYNWRYNKNGWCKSLSLQGRGVITFKPGEAAVLNNTTESPIKLKLPSPVSSN